MRTSGGPPCSVILSKIDQRIIEIVSESDEFPQSIDARAILQYNMPDRTYDFPNKIH